MAAMTHAEARTEVADHVDDASNKRWSVTQIDAALKTQIAACMDDYISSGGDRFDEEVTGTTSGADNELDISTYDPLEIKGVSVQIGSNFYPIKRRKRRDRGAVDATARALQIYLVRTPSFPTSTSDPLITSDGTTAMKTWPTFDSWVCAEAALQLSVKDAELQKALKRHADRLRHICMTKGTASRSIRFPRRAPDIGIDYIWDQGGQLIGIVRSPSWLLYEAS